MRFISLEERPPPINLADVFKKRPVFAKLFRHLKVELAFVHGSLAKDALKPLSDVDIAVQFKKDSFTYQHISEANLKLCELIGREDVDLMVLNTASPLACMQVLCNGKLLFCRNEKTLKEFRFRTIQCYLSTKYLRDSFNRYMRAAILGGK